MGTGYAVASPCRHRPATESYARRSPSLCDTEMRLGDIHHGRRYRNRSFNLRRIRQRTDPRLPPHDAADKCELIARLVLGLEKLKRLCVFSARRPIKHEIARCLAITDVALLPRKPRRRECPSRSYAVGKYPTTFPVCGGEFAPPQHFIDRYVGSALPQFAPCEQP